MIKCRDCEFCLPCGKAKSTRNNAHGYPRVKYYCTNPLTIDLPIKVFGNKAMDFIGYGTTEYGSPLTVKTSPKWCPLRSK